MTSIETSWVVGIALIVVLVLITASGRGTHYKPTSPPAASTQTQH
ncbi:hypothetical protein GGQ85_001031 [Nitrobacter vulgaris]|nr:hypothetical protein [Nitrobacter vulgaris]